jgi:outer membrane protein assembly factor BamD
MHAVDQDQSPTEEVVLQFRFLLERFPESEYAPDARAKLAEAEDRLSGHILHVADFYFDRGEYYAAAERYREAPETYPDHARRTRTLYRLALSLWGLGETGEAEAILVRILESEPDGDLNEEVEEALRDLNGRS